MVSGESRFETSVCSTYMLKMERMRLMDYSAAQFQLIFILKGIISRRNIFPINFNLDFLFKIYSVNISLECQNRCLVQ